MYTKARVVFKLFVLLSIALLSFSAMAGGRRQSNDPDLAIPRHRMSSPPDDSDIEYLQAQISHLESKINGLESRLSDLEDKVSRGY